MNYKKTKEFLEENRIWGYIREAANYRNKLYWLTK